MGFRTGKEFLLITGNSTSFSPVYTLGLQHLERVHPCLLSPWRMQIFVKTLGVLVCIQLFYVPSYFICYLVGTCNRLLSAGPIPDNLISLSRKGSRFSTPPSDTEDGHIGSYCDEFGPHSIGNTKLARVTGTGWPLSTFDCYPTYGDVHLNTQPSHRHP